MRVRNLVPMIVLGTVAAVSPGLGEVAAKLNEEGGYQCMSYRYTASGGTGRVWSTSVVSSNRRALNPNGDRLGDLAPSVVENGARSNWPVAVWSHPSGGDYDLVYSGWNGTSWSPMRYVQADNSQNDLEPRLAFNSYGEIYLVWWSEDSGIGTVYFSYFTGERWSPPTRVSRQETDSRRGNMILVSDNLVRITYETFRGTETRDVIFARGDTITDDIDPKRDVSIVVGP